MKKPLPPLTAVLKTAKLEIVQECEIPLEQFPDMIELEQLQSTPPTLMMAGLSGLPGPKRQFFRIGITDRRGFYREGSSYRISQ